MKKFIIIPFERYRNLTEARRESSSDQFREISTGALEAPPRTKDSSIKNDHLAVETTTQQPPRPQPSVVEHHSINPFTTQPKTKKKKLNQTNSQTPKATAAQRRKDGKVLPAPNGKFWIRP